MSTRRSIWSRYMIPAHVGIVIVSGVLLASTNSLPILRGILMFLSGVSFFVLTGLVHEGSHNLLSRRPWLNDLYGNLAGTALATPVSAYRALHMKHHQTTNQDEDPNKILKSRWMLLVGAPTYILLTHLYAWRHFRGRALARYLAELAGMMALIGLVCALPRPIREWSIIGPMIIVGVLQNVRIVTGHMDLPSGKYHDTWQLVLPSWLSAWLLHYDHHLEHHIRPRMSWYQLPELREQLSLKPGLPLLRVTLPQFFYEVFLTRRYVLPSNQASYHPHIPIGPGAESAEARPSGEDRQTRPSRA